MIELDHQRSLAGKSSIKGSHALKYHHFQFQFVKSAFVTLSEAPCLLK